MKVTFVKDMLCKKTVLTLKVPNEQKDSLSLESTSYYLEQSKQLYHTRVPCRQAYRQHAKVKQPENTQTFIINLSGCYPLLLLS